jgi:hypothetical protein
MRKNMKRLLFGLPLIFTAATLLAQDTTPTELSGAAAGMAFGGICIFQLIMIAIWLFVARPKTIPGQNP